MKTTFSPLNPFPFHLQPENADQTYMKAALQEAWKAYTIDEVPVGAVLVLKDRIIARGHNQVEMLQDATAHAEILCITSGEAALENWRLLHTTLYCTIEPCCMCAGAMFLSRVGKLVWGAPDVRHGANGSFVNLFQETHPMHEIEVESCVYQEEASSLLRSFFQRRRES